jgi:hypothetical protein
MIAQKYILLITLCMAVCFPEAKAQIGSNHSLDFLNLSTNAKLTAISEVNVSSMIDSAGSDAGMFMYNPALIGPGASEKLSLSYMPYYAGINHASLSYAHHHQKYGTWALGLQYLDYGDFDGYDASGLPAGEFSAQSYAFVLNHVHQQGNFRMGANLKVAVSSISGYTASALLFDLGGIFRHPTQDFTAGLVISNLGFFLQDYSGSSDSRLPTDLRLGLSFKPEHMPFRFSITGHKLLRDRKAYFESDSSGGQGDDEGDVSVADKIFRHLTFGGEILLGDNFHLRAGYNSLVRAGMRLPQTGGGAGFTYGFMVRIKMFMFEFARTSHQVSGGFSHFTLTTDIERLLKKRN